MQAMTFSPLLVLLLLGQGGRLIVWLGSRTDDQPTSRDSEPPERPATPVHRAPPFGRPSVVPPGVEPERLCGRWHLKPVRLPIPP